MSASIASTSASSDSTTDPKAQFQDVIDSLESLKKIVDARKVKWDVSQVKVLVSQLKILKRPGMKECISTGNMKTLEEILRHMGRDWPENQPTTQSINRAQCCRDYVWEGEEEEDKRSMLEKWVDELVEQMNSHSFHPQTPTWEPRTPADHVGGISRALESLLKYDVRWGWTPDVKKNLEDLRDRIEKLNIKNISNHGDEAGMLEEFYGIVRGTGNTAFMERHDLSEIEKKRMVLPNLEKLNKLALALEQAIKGQP